VTYRSGIEAPRLAGLRRLRSSAARLLGRGVSSLRLRRPRLCTLYEVRESGPCLQCKAQA
jgi:hypothetical protein